MPSRSLDTTPRADGFHMPAEWEPHGRCYVVWPERTDTWRMGAKPAQVAFAAVAESVAAHEPVTVLCLLPPMGARSFGLFRVDPGHRDDHRRRLGPRHRPDLRGRPVDGSVAGGGLDLQRLGRSRRRALLPLGQRRSAGGQDLRTGGGPPVPCALGPRRGIDPRRRRRHLHHHRRVPPQPQSEPRPVSPPRSKIVSPRYLGIEKVIWIPRGVYGDETDGHVDNLACFTRPGRVLLTWTEDAGDPQAPISAEARRLLESTTDARGRQLDVGLLPSPGPLTMTTDEAAGIDGSGNARLRSAGDRLAGSYVNFRSPTASSSIPCSTRATTMQSPRR